MHTILKDNRHYKLYLSLIESSSPWTVAQLKMLLFDSKGFMSES